MAIGAIVSGLNPLALIDVASLIIVLLPALVGAAAGAKPGELGLLVKALTGNRLDASERLKASRLFRLMGRVSLGAGLVGFLIALIQIAQSLPAAANIDSAALGRAFAAALVTPLIGFVFKFFVFEPAATRAE